MHQRPQLLLARLAKGWRVLHVEEPVHGDGRAQLETREISSRLTVLVPHTPVAAVGFHDDQLAHLQPMLAAALRVRGLHADVAWLYTPMALPLAKSFAPTCLVSECMDELTGFKDAPRQLRQRESALLQEAAQVFTGGPSLYEARRALHPSVHCYPSVVDAAHFAPGNLDSGCDHAKLAAALQDGLPRPSFVQACEAVLAEPAAARCKRNIEMLNTVSMHSWQRTAESMDGLLRAALRQANQQLAGAAPAQPIRLAAAGS